MKKYLLILTAFLMILSGTAMGQQSAKRTIPAPFRAGNATKVQAPSPRSQKVAAPLKRMAPKAVQSQVSMSQLQGDSNFSCYGYTWQILDQGNVQFYPNHDLKMFYWTFDDPNSGNNNTSQLKNPIHYFSQPGSYNVCLEGGDTVGNCQGGVYCSTISVPGDTSQGCYANFTYAAIDHTVNFQNNSGGASTYSWYFGDGGYSDQIDPVYTYSADGYYSVTLTVFNPENNCQQSFTQEIKVGNGGCLAKFFAQPVNQGDSSAGSSTTYQFINNSEYNAMESVSWYWDFGNGNYSYERDPVYTYPDPGYYSVCLTINGGENCYNQTCNEITVGNVQNDCKASFGHYVDNSTRTVYFTDYSYGSISKWYWDFGNGQGYSDMQNPVYQYDNSGYFIVGLSTFDSVTGCQSYWSEMVKVGEEGGCAADFIFFVDSNGHDVSFNDKSLGDASSYYWDFGDYNSPDNYSYDPNPTHHFKEDGYYTVCLYTYDDSTQCNSSICYTIIVGDGEQSCHASYSYYSDENTNTVYFYDNSYGSVSSWYWSFGDGKGFSTDQNPIYTYAEAGFFDVFLSTYDSASNCYSDYHQIVKVGKEGGCAADFEFFVDSNGNDVNFSNSSLGNATSYYWDFGDYNSYENYSYEENPSHFYKYEGYYNVCLYIYNESTGCNSSKCMTIAVGDVEQACQAGFGAYANPQNQSAQFYDQSRGNLGSWFWDFGDGNYSTDQYPYHEYANPGIYYVCLTVASADSANSCQDQYCDKVQIDDGQGDFCYTDFSYYPDSSGNTVYFSDASTNAHNWNWYFGDGGYSSLQNPSHEYTEAGYYYVTLYTSDSSGNCASERSYYIQIGSGGCSASFTFYPAGGNAVSFNQESRGDVAEYYWDFGDGTFGTDPYVYHQYEQEGFYEVCLSIKTADGSCEDRMCQKVSVGSEQCNPEFTYFVDNQTNTANFYVNNPSPDLIYYWDFGNGDYSNDANPVQNYDASGYYTVCLSIQNATTGCGNQSCQGIQIGDGGACRAEFNYFVDPSNNTVSFTNNSHSTDGGTLKYYWSFGDGETSIAENPKHTYDEDGHYYVHLSISNAAGDCFDEYSEVVKVGNVGCYADFGYCVVPDSMGVILYNYSSGGNKFYWDFGDGKISGNESPRHYYKEAGYYTICLTVFNEKDNCTDIRCYDVQIGDGDCKASFGQYVDGNSRVVRFENNSVGDFTESYWDFGDGAYSYKKNPAHKYPANGYYYVCLNVYNTATGCYDYYCDNVLVGAEEKDCAAQFDFYNDPSTKVVKFEDHSVGGATQFFWDFGDDSYGDGKQVSHTYDKAGIYYVCQYIINEDNGCYNTACNYVQVGDGGDDCEAIFKSSVDSASRKVKFSDISKGDPTSWNWDFGDGATSNVQNPSHTYAANGFYSVELKTKSANGCESFFVDVVNVNGGDSLQATFGEDVKDTVVVEGINGVSILYPVEFRGEAFGDVAKFSWNFGDGLPIYDKGKRITHDYAKPGLYNVCLTVNDPVIGKTDTYCKKVKTAGYIKSGINISNMDLLKFNCYPNPFNQRTTVSYQLPEASKVEITVIDLLGNVIQTLANDNMLSGKHQLTWDATSVADGVYFIQIQTNHAVVSKRVTLVR